MTRFSIYLCTHIASGKKYVGQTKKSVQARWRQHATSAARDDNKSIVFANAIRKYGRDAFVVETIEVVNSQEEANTAESRWIAHFDCRSPNGYNLDGGGGVGPKHEETIQKIRRTKALTTPEKKREAAQKRWASLTPEQKADWVKKVHAGMTTEQRSALMKATMTPENRAKAAAARSFEERSATSKAWHSKKTPEYESERTRKIWASKTLEERAEWSRQISAGKQRVPVEVRSEVARKRAAAMTSEQRSDVLRRANASRTPEQRSEISRKQWLGITPEQRSEMARVRNASLSPEKRVEKAQKVSAARRRAVAAKRLLRERRSFWEKSHDWFVRERPPAAASGTQPQEGVG